MCWPKCLRQPPLLKSSPGSPLVEWTLNCSGSLTHLRTEYKPGRNVADPLRLLPYHWGGHLQDGCNITGIDVIFFGGGGPMGGGTACSLTLTLVSLRLQNLSATVSIYGLRAACAQIKLQITKTISKRTLGQGGVATKLFGGHTIKYQPPTSSFTCCPPPLSLKIVLLLTVSPAPT